MATSSIDEYPTPSPITFSVQQVQSYIDKEITWDDFLERIGPDGYGFLFEHGESTADSVRLTFGYLLSVQHTTDSRPNLNMSNQNGCTFTPQEEVTLIKNNRIIQHLQSSFQLKEYEGMFSLRSIEKENQSWSMQIAKAEISYCSDDEDKIIGEINSLSTDLDDMVVSYVNALCVRHPNMPPICRIKEYHTIGYDTGKHNFLHVGIEELPSKIHRLMKIFKSKLKPSILKYLKN